MFERFTDRARRVVVLAQEEARLLNHNYIGTEHILLGFIREGEGVAARSLQSLGVELDAVREQVLGFVGRGDATMLGHIPFTPPSKKVLELSLREALRLKHDYIGTEHILLGLLREGEGVAAQVLIKAGVEMQDARDAVVQLLSSVREGESDNPSGLGHDPGWTKHARSGSPYEERYGFSRGVRMGDRIEIAGTAPVPPDGEEVAPTAYEQMIRCGQIALEAVVDLGGDPSDVVRTVMYITEPADSDEIGRAHAGLFGEAAPAATMVIVVGLLDPAWKVEIEVSAQL